MSVTIRLAKYGKKFAPTYKVVVVNTKSKRSGKFIESLGYYNPSKKPAELKLDKKAYDDWVSKGALVSKAAKELYEGTYKFVPYNPKTKKQEDTQEEVVEKASE